MVRELTFLKRLNLRYGGILAAYAAITWLVFRDEVMGPLLVPLRAMTAEGALTLIHLAGMEAVRAGSAIYYPGGFAFEISRGCTGMVGAGLLVVAILAYPAARDHRVIGVSLCVPVFLGVNLVRLVHLFHLGVYRPDLFHVFHTVVWQGIMAAAAFGLWFGWIVWVQRAGVAPRPAAPQSSSLPRHRLRALGGLSTQPVGK